MNGLIAPPVPKIAKLTKLGRAIAKPKSLSQHQVNRKVFVQQQVDQYRKQLELKPELVADQYFVEALQSAELELF